MTVPRTVADVMRDHVTLEVECIDRMYLNLYVPLLQSTRGCAYYWRKHRGYAFASSALMQPMSRAFVSAIERFAEREAIPLIRFGRERKDDVVKQYRDRFSLSEGVPVIGKAQERAKVVRTEKRRDKNGQPYPWLVDATAMVNHYYFYCEDDDFGPFFLKFCSYFPYNGKLCINGHEYVKRQLVKEGIEFEALDNGIRSCADPVRLQQICDELSAEKIDALVRKWFARLPHPFSASDRGVGCRYNVSMLQSEFALTQVHDRPRTGRILFEQIIRENLDIGRPDRVQLVFQRRVIKTTPGRFRTRVLTEGVTPSLYLDYKRTRIKQYHKEGRALRTETTINNTYDFKIGKLLKNLPELRKVGFQANRRLLRVQRLSQDCTIGEDAFERVHRPVYSDNQRVSALRFGDQRVLALLSAILVFRLLPRGFSNRSLREQVAPLLGLEPGQYTQGKMTYDLRRLRLHGIIRRIPKSNRYEVTDFGFRFALFVTRGYARLFRTGLAHAMPDAQPPPSPFRQALERLDRAVDKAWNEGRIAA
jgi:hypothetical protein